MLQEREWSSISISQFPGLHVPFSVCNSVDVSDIEHWNHILLSDNDKNTIGSVGEKMVVGKYTKMWESFSHKIITHSLVEWIKRASEEEREGEERDSVMYFHPRSW